MTDESSMLESDLLIVLKEDCRELLDHVTSSLRELLGMVESPPKDRFSSVYSSAHLLKGAAGILDPVGFQPLSHKLESVLHAVCWQDLTPTKEILNVVLEGYGSVGKLMDGLGGSVSIPVDAQEAQLSTILEPYSSAIAVSSETCCIPLGQANRFAVDPLRLHQSKAIGNDLYHLAYDLNDDLQVQGKSCMDLLRTLADMGYIMDSTVEPADAEGDKDGGNRIMLHVLLATTVEPQHVNSFVHLPAERVRHIDEAEESVPVAKPTTFQAAFGSALLTVREGAGRIMVPKHLEAHSLNNMRAALSAALTRCSSLVVDWSAVAECDVFFFQMLCVAQHSFNAKGKALSMSGGLDSDMRIAASSMGFGCNGSPGCLFGGV